MKPRFPFFERWEPHQLGHSLPTAGRLRRWAAALALLWLAAAALVAWVLWSLGRPGTDPAEASYVRQVALERLARAPRGFVLVVEGGRIDHGHHAGNAYRALTETIEFARAVRIALERTSEEETLVVVTADHDHGFGTTGYATRGNPILGLVVGNDARGEPASGPTRDALGLPYTSVGYLTGPGYTGASNSQPRGPKRFPHRPEAVKGIRGGRPDLTDVATGDPDYLQEAAVPLRSGTHAGTDVPIYAGGPGAWLFHGVQEQSYVYHAIVEALGWRDPARADPR